MKCTNCGINNANCHYKYSINGKVTEQHLCSECAKKLHPERQFAADAKELFGGFEEPMNALVGNSFFDDDSFFDNDGFFDDDFFNMGNMMNRMMGGFMRPMMGFFPTYRIYAPNTMRTVREPAAPDTAAGSCAAVDPELSRQREINSIREKMKSAAENEDYETAAKLRDQLKSMENKQ